MPKSVVVDTSFMWGNDRPPDVPWMRRVFYETHVRGYTMLHPDVPPATRGTFTGLSSPRVIEHMLDLGVTTVELLPVHAFIDDRYLIEKRLRNYWGYNSIGFFAPESRYLAAHHDEFKTMVKNLHEAGLEVVLDVVYNHTAEGNQLGPTLSFRGIDNASYYRLAEDKRYYEDTTGCGNTLNLRHPRVLQMVTDSLRYWVEEMHVDGFRFDLATTLAREDHGYTYNAAFFKALKQDPVLARSMLIAEPWDVGMGGYQVGGFPPGWSEWNGKYRDTVRRYWQGNSGLLAEFASRLAGSSDLFHRHGRRPRASINFVTVHDGFTMTDLVSYNNKINEANLEDNRDGTDDNASWNCGTEGPTDDPAIVALRDRQKRNLIATLFLSLGVPMLLAGDEFGRTQRGNNNAYCQDNEISWVDWNGRTARDLAFQKFVKSMLRVRARTSRVSTRSILHGPSPAGQHPSGHRLVYAGRQTDERRRLARRRTRDRRLLRRPPALRGTLQRGRSSGRIRVARTRHRAVAPAARHRLRRSQRRPRTRRDGRSGHRQRALDRRIQRVAAMNARELVAERYDDRAGDGAHRSPRRRAKRSSPRSNTRRARASHRRCACCAKAIRSRSTLRWRPSTGTKTSSGRSATIAAT